MGTPRVQEKPAVDQELKKINKEVENKVTHNGRSYSDITKKVLKVIAGILLTVIIVAALVSLTAGLIGLMNPSLLQTLVDKLASSGNALAALVKKTVTWIAVNPKIMTIAGGVGLGVAAAGIAVVATADKCCKGKKKDEDADLEDVDAPSDVEEGEEEVEGGNIPETPTSSKKPQQQLEKEDEAVGQ